MPSTFLDWKRIMKKRVFFFPNGLPSNAKLVEHVFTSLAKAVGKDAPLEFTKAKLELVDSDGTQYIATANLEDE